MLYISGIQEFVMVANKGSFTLAAEALQCSKSYVSKQVKELEQRLGVLLFNRNTRGLRLTELGESFFIRCATAFGELEDATNAIAAASDVPRGPLRVHIAAAFGEFTIADILTEFSNLYPQLRLHVDFTSNSVDMILGNYDALITRGVLKDSSLIAHKLAESDFGLYGSPSYFKRFGIPESAADLARHNCLVDGSETWWLDHSSEALRIKVDGRWKSNRGSLLLRAAVTGVGIAQLPSYPLRELIDRGALVAVPGTWSHWRASWYVLFPRRIPQVPRVRLLVDFLAEHFAKPGHFRLLSPMEI